MRRTKLVSVSRFAAPCSLAWPNPNTHTWASAGDYADAASQYKAAAATSQQFLPRGLSMLYNNLAAACLALKDDAGAVQACDKALQADPWNHKAYIRRADTLMVRQTKPNQTTTRTLSGAPQLTNATCTAHGQGCRECC